MTLFDQNFHCS